ncbi:MAG TPA: DUF1599 domain-containing protein [Chitinophagaceae bacterium]|nr:DUF1599 domain-containing protein [Chitinophagaceae bacterium]
MQTEPRDTLAQYDHAVHSCKDLFLKKTTDYGTAWRVLRPISVIDQVYIKAQRIRTIQELKTQRIEDDITSEFIGILNYAVIGLIQLHIPEDAPEELPVGEVDHLYDLRIKEAKGLMQEKNHDYGEAWRSMSQESLTDLILMKLQRMRQIIVNDGRTLVSEGLDANYYDIVNYAVFAIILINENKPAQL